MADTGLRGLALLDAAIAQIEAHPETWNQGDWRCESGMCVAGWMSDLAGGVWVDPAAEVWPAHLIAEDGELGLDVVHDLVNVRDVYIIHAEDRAERLLGMSPYMKEALNDPEDCRDLFAPLNYLADIKDMRDDLAALLAVTA